MATNWFDPTGSNAGFYNSPQDFLFKSQGGTWYGQGPSGQSDAAKMPTMADYYFGGGQQAAAAPASSPTPPVGPTFGSPVSGVTSQATSRMGGGGSINFGNNVSVPQGPLWQRYQALQANPALMEADPAFRYMMEQGEEALGRTAGARRKRFAGETMLDFQKHAQGQAAGYLQRMLPELRAGAGQEYGMLENEAKAKGQMAQVRSMAADPYGGARNLAHSYSSLNELMSSPLYSQWARTSAGPQRLIDMWTKGQELNKSMGF